MTEALLPIVQKINGYLSDYILVALLIAVGLWYSIKTRFVQVRHFKEGWNSVFGSLSLRGGKQESGMSSFQALATAIAAQVGTGNIVGASGAILTGGPGAIFWMWVIAFFGMATIYAEATLALTTRQVDKDGTIHGGPVYYIKRAFNNGFGTFLAVFFAIAITLALGFIGCMVQSNSIGQTCSTAFGIPAWVIGIVVAILAAIIFLGGVNRVAAVTEKLVPIMAVLYLVGGLILLILRLPYLPETIGMIFKYAFFPNAIIGGGLGYALKTAISQGVKRGLGRLHVWLSADDVLILHEDTVFLHLVIEWIGLYYANELRIGLNPRWKIGHVTDGVDTGGYVHFPDHVRVRKRNKVALCRQIARLRKKGLPDEEIRKRASSRIGFIQHADTSNLLNKLGMETPRKRLGQVIRNKKSPWEDLPADRKMRFEDILYDTRIPEDRRGPEEDRLIELIDYKIEDSKIERNEDGTPKKCLAIRFRWKGEERYAFTGSAVLIDQALTDFSHEDLPVDTVIKVLTNKFGKKFFRFT